MLLNRRQWLIVMSVIPVMLVLAMIIAQWQIPVQAQDAGGTGKMRTITVTGIGEITVEPDVAYVNLGVVTEGKTAEEAQSANAEIFAKLNDVLFKQFEIGEKDVQTSGFRVRPEYVYREDKEPTISGYKAVHSIRIAYRELDRIGELVDAASKAGANEVNNIQFATEKADEYEIEAMKEAMNNAREKAEVLAAAENQTIKGAVSISQSGASGGVYYGESVSLMMDTASSADRAGSSVNPGEIVIRSQVNVVYEF